MARRRFPTIHHDSLDARLVSTAAVGFKVKLFTNLIFHLLMLTISVTANENHAHSQSPSTTPITLKQLWTKNKVVTLCTNKEKQIGACFRKEYSLENCQYKLLVFGQRICYRERYVHRERHTSHWWWWMPMRAWSMIGVDNVYLAHLALYIYVGSIHTFVQFHQNAVE